MRKLYLTLCTLILSVAAYAIGPITGNLNLCVGSTTTLADTAAGGTWSSSTPAIATIGSASGIVSGLTAGTTTIKYKTATDSATAVVEVHAAPGACPQPVGCVGVADTLTGCVVPGYWSSPVVMVDTNTGKGYLTAMAAGTTTVTYTVKISGCTATTIVTVNAGASAGVITGLSTICVGTISTLSDTVTGGTWTSSDPAVAVVGSTNGIVAGVSNGTATITYTVSGTCGTAFTTKVVNVVTTPSAGIVSGPSAVCTGMSVTLSSTVTGGVWSSSSSANASVNASTGVVTGIIAGSATISYTVTLSCGTGVTTVPVTVSGGTPAIHSAPGFPTYPDVHAICVGNGVGLTVYATFGTWSSSNPAVSSVTSTGIAYGVSAGTATITFTASSGCYSTYDITVNAPLAPVTGMLNLCFGSTTVLSGTPTGGTWISSNLAIATVGISSGVVSSSTSNGTATITYTVGGCSVTSVVTVFPFVSPITGSTQICKGAIDSLEEATAGGRWSSSDTMAVTIDSVSGVITGLAVGTSTIFYTVPGTGCVPSIVLTVNATPAAITGAGTICLGATVTLADTTAGGTWSSGANTTASVNPFTGIVTGITGGSTIISYTLGTGCYAIKAVTVTPSTISGVSTIPVGVTTTLSNTATGGAWGSSNTAVATVGASSGVVTGVTQGTAIMTYQVAGSCYATKTITVTHGVGVQETATNGASVYPNPTSGNLNIEWGSNARGEATITITDIAGRNAGSYNVTIGATPYTLSVEHLQNGIYFISVRGEHVNYSGKVTVNR
ncbi:MAG: Ig-like domain-containing protein [Bacteroidota bacterium]